MRSSIAGFYSHVVPRPRLDGDLEFVGFRKAVLRYEQQEPKVDKISLAKSSILPDY
jgi:hypothetical protein